MTPSLFSVVKDARLDLSGSKKNLKNSVFVGFFKEFIFIFLIFFLLMGWSGKCVHLLFVVN